MNSLVEHVFCDTYDTLYRHGRFGIECRVHCYRQAACTDGKGVRLVWASVMQTHEGSDC